MKLPKKVKVGGHWYTIVFPHKFRERSDICGQRDAGVTEIRILETDPGGNKYSDSVIIVTFIHEILHAIDYVSGHHVFKDNEKAIEGLSEGIYQVLVDNKWLS